jgi:hypothetical protein
MGLQRLRWLQRLQMRRLQMRLERVRRLRRLRRRLLLVLGTLPLVLVGSTFRLR